MHQFINLDIEEAVSSWHRLLTHPDPASTIVTGKPAADRDGFETDGLDKDGSVKDGLSRDVLVFSESADALVHFVSHYTQFLAVCGQSEVAVFYGAHIGSLADFCYQANTVLPCGFRRRVDLQVLYDLLLNFETEPLNRILIWNDAQELFNTDARLFADIFECMVAAAYCNRNAVSTVKEDNTRFRVNQRNLFVFNGVFDQRIQTALVDKTYLIPSIDGPFQTVLPFRIVNLFDSSQRHQDQLQKLLSKDISQIMSVFEKATDWPTLDFFYDHLVGLTQRWQEPALVRIAESKLSLAQDPKGWMLDRVVDARKIIGEPAN